MKKRNGFTLVEFLVVAMIAVLALFAPVGYVCNIVKLCKCDFKSPIKAEVIRGIGVVVSPVGVVAGFLTISDDPSIK